MAEPLANFPIGTAAIYVSASTTEPRKIINSGGATVYYDNASTVSATSNDGNLTAGASATFTTGTWLMTATTSHIFVMDSPPAMVFEDLTISDDATVTDDLLVSGTLSVTEDLNVTDDLDADAITGTSISVDGAGGLVATADGGKDTLSLSNTAANVGITIGADVELFRSAADELVITDHTTVTGGVTSTGTLAATNAATVGTTLGVTGVASTDGGIVTGAATPTTAAKGITFGTGADPATLYRSAANTLKTDDALTVVGNLDADAITGTSVSVDGATGLVATANGGKDTLALTDTTADVGITIGGDTNLYREGANIAATDDKLHVVLELEVDGALNHDGTTVGLYGVTPVTRAAAITAPTAPGAIYAQAEAQAMETAVNAIRTALLNIGVTS